MRHMFRTLTAASAGVLVISAALSAHDRITTKVTWNREISRIVQARCVSCHVEGGRAPMALSTYEQARPWAKAIRDEVLARRMPKWHAARGYGDFSNDPSLSPFEVAVVVAWAEGGAPRGTGKPVTDSLARPSSAASSPPPSPGARETVLSCGEQSFTGYLLAVRPTLADGGSATIAAILPDGRREIVAWIRDYDPEFPTRYWLRTPLELPAGSRMDVRASGGRCSLGTTIR